jgi:peptidoglycan/xylan/chitin deacetylase (PgdA/CDA1 family)
MPFTMPYPADSPSLSLFPRLAARSGLAALARWILARGGRFALNFHGVSRQRYPNVPRDLQPHHTVDEFRDTLAWLAPRFPFLRLDDFLHTAKPGVLLTFDDGHANNLFNILPILAEFRAQGLFFVTVQHVQNPRNWLGFTREYARRGWGAEQNIPEDFARDCYDGLSEAQLAQLAASPWAVIGSHTLHHPHLPELSSAALRRELEESRRALAEISRQPVATLAYPYGEYNRPVAEAARASGYRAAFAVIPQGVGLPAYEIPRADLYYPDPDYLALKLSGLRWPAQRAPILPAS